MKTNLAKFKKSLIILVSLAIITPFLFKYAGAWPIYTYKKPAKETVRLSESTALPKVLTYTKNNYIDPSRVDPKAMLKGALDAVQKTVPEILVTYQGSNSFTLTVDQASKNFSISEANSLGGLMSVLKDIFAFVDLHYQGDVEKEEIGYAAIDGMLNTLDPHSSLLPPKIYNEFKIGTKGEFGGIGIVIGVKEGRLTVIAPLEGTPAYNAGIKAKDVIVQIEDASTINMTITDAVERLRGQVGTPISLTIERPDRPAPFTVTLKRAVIQIDSIKWALLPAGEKNIGYIKVKNFQEDTHKDFKKALEALRSSAGGKFAGLIIDLRNNPGGLLDQSNAIVDDFISDGIIVGTVGANNKFLDQSVAHPTGTEPSYPVITLVNEGSASASEIVAGSLQGNSRAPVIGSRTFGKGTVQTVYDLHDGSALKLTIAQYLTAGKYAIQTVGVLPDVKIHPAIPDKKHMDLIEDEFLGETALEKHLTKVLNPSPHADYVIDYLEKSEEKDEDELSRREYSKKVDIIGDFPAELARDILAITTTSNPDEMIKNAKSLIALKEKEQEQKIQDTLKKLGLDWETGKANGKPELQVTYELKKGGQNIETATAGDTIDIVLTARNIGSGAFYRLVGVSKSDDYFLKNKEFVFGKLSPGEARSWSSQIKVPMSLPSETVPVDVEFHEANNNVPVNFKILIPSNALPRPQFAFSYKLLTPITVNPAEALPKGKSIPFEVRIKNVGEGPAEEATATLRNADKESGIFIEAGRAKLGKIAPGETKKVLFKFHINPNETKSEFNLEFSITDLKLFELLTKKIAFTVGSGNITPQAGIWHQGPQITINAKRFPINTSAPTETVSGTVKDDHQVKNLFIFVGEDKVFYKSNPNESSTLSFSAPLALKDGNNVITMEARDDNDLPTRIIFVIHRGAP